MNEYLQIAKEILTFITKNTDEIMGVLEELKPTIIEIKNYFYSIGSTTALTQANYYANLHQCFLDKGFSREETMLLILNAEMNSIKMQRILDRISKSNS